jgi:hypothetical protein
MENEEAAIIATMIYKQYGGREFAMVTGAKKFQYLKGGGLIFEIGKNEKKVKYVETKIDKAEDLYDVKFYNKMGKVLSIEKGLFAEDLHDTFQQNTHLYASLLPKENESKINFNGGNAMKATTIMAGITGLEVKAGESKGVLKEGEKGDYEVKKGEIYLRVFEHPGKDGKNQKESYGNTVMKLSPQEAHKIAGALKTVAETREAKQSLYPVSPHKFEKDGKTTETVIAVSKDTFKDKQGNDKEAVVLNIGKGEENSKEKTWLKVNMTKDDAMYLSDFTKALAVEQSYENSKKVEKTQSQGAER